MDDEQQSKSALHHLMQHAKRRKMKHATTNSSIRESPLSKFFPCPAGCGRHVSERDVNVHLDGRCAMLNGAAAASQDQHERQSEELDGSYLNLDKQDKADARHVQGSNNTEPVRKNSSISPARATKQSPGGYSITSKTKISNTPSKQIIGEKNAFTHMMKQSAKIFSNESQLIVKHKFHLLQDSNDDRITTTWIDGTDDVNSTIKDEVVWSSSVTVKKVKSIALNDVHKSAEHFEMQNEVEPDATMLELEVSSSIPFQNQQMMQVSDGNSNKYNFVHRHSRLSVAHLKSILQKSIRRRAPLPAVRIAMELADKSFGDLIRRLSVIMLEDSYLHEDLDVIVWLMVAESKGYVPPMSLLVRIFQIVFEIASCSRRDELSDGTASHETNVKDEQPKSFSLTTPSAKLFPDVSPASSTSTNKCETLIRSMLLRAQYGGMACDVSMLHYYASLWLTRFQSSVPVPPEVASSLLRSNASESRETAIFWRDIPGLRHEPCREKSKELVTCKVIRPGGLLRLNEADICAAGIDFHCSPVVDNLLSRSSVYSSLCDKLAPLNKDNGKMNCDWIASQVKKCIWNFSSGVNHRRALIEKQDEASNSETILKVAWDEVLRVPFNNFTKNFVRQRLASEF